MPALGGIKLSSAQGSPQQCGGDATRENPKQGPSHLQAQPVSTHPPELRCWLRAVGTAPKILSLILVCHNLKL